MRPGDFTQIVAIIRYEFSDIAINVGDTVRLTATATSTTAGTALVENLTTGLSASQALSGENSLEELKAGWYILPQDDSIDFGTITFEDARATFSSGTVGPLDATVLDQSYATVSTTSDSVIVKYGSDLEIKPLNR
ncbi:hypothetical protein SLS53_005736 [Cytospora paraplurivora]|uniref:Uncharacterized protein n=1 Tax=Cytospora paraplurivora TaxID=2898453 RepID=A0AAN9YE93_9PEZI